MKPAHLNNRGVTLLEMVISLAVITMIMTGVTSLYFTSRQSTTAIWDSLEVQRSARNFTREFRDNVRRATIANNGAYPLLTTTNDEFTFYADIDSDGLVERVRYQHDSTTLIRGVIKPTGTPYVYNVSDEVTTTLVRGVQNASVSSNVFEYYDQSYPGDGPSLPAPVDLTTVTAVSVYLYLDEDLSSTPAPFEVSTAAHLRNLKAK